MATQFQLTFGYTCLQELEYFCSCRILSRFVMTLKQLLAVQTECLFFPLFSSSSFIFCFLGPNNCYSYLLEGRIYLPVPSYLGSCEDPSF